MNLRPLIVLICVSLLTIGFASDPNSLSAQIQIGGPNGVVFGGGRGLRIGGGNGVQLGGGQGLRFGPPGIGVQYGGGQGVRYGTTNFGVQYGGGQLLRYGTPNAGVKIGGGEGARWGTRRGGVQFGTGQGLQIGRFNSPTTDIYPANRVPIFSGLDGRSGVYTPNQNQSSGVGQAAFNSNDPSSPISNVGNRPSHVENANFSMGTGRISRDLARPAPEATESSNRLSLTLPATAKQPVNYQVNESDLIIRPGQTVYFQPGQNWKISVLGSKNAKRDFQLEEAKAYQLVEGADGWQVDGVEPTVSAIAAAQPTASPTNAVVPMKSETPVEKPKPLKKPVENTKSPIENDDPFSMGTKPASPPAASPIESIKPLDVPTEENAKTETNSILEFNSKK